MDEGTRIEVEAATFRRLIKHLQDHPEAQNIDLMILADFCRNCLAKWTVDAAREQGEQLSYEEARTMVYGMTYAEWKAEHQRDATPEQLAAYAARQAAKGG